MGNGTEGNQDEQPRRTGRTGPTVPSPQELERRFLFHPPRDAEAITSHAKVSDLTLALAIELCKLCPGGRNLSLALTALEDVRMRANAAIAVDDPRP